MHRLCATFAPLLLALAAGCAPKAEALAPVDLTALRFKPTSPTEGIFPDVSVVNDPQNPFANVSFYSIDAVHNPAALQFKLNESAAAGPTSPTYSPAARFYIWATILARASPEGDGEAQHYAAASLDPTIPERVANASDLPLVKEMAIAAFSEVLTQFPTAVTFDQSGTIKYELLTPSLQGILDLGGQPPSGWIMITDNMGIKRAVKQ
jgi:hypothetical protein